MVTYCRFSRCSPKLSEKNQLSRHKATGCKPIFGSRRGGREAAGRRQGTFPTGIFPSEFVFTSGSLYKEVVLSSAA